MMSRFIIATANRRRRSHGSHDTSSRSSRQLTSAPATVALYETDVSEEPIFALLVGATAVTAWFGGFGPALLVIAIGWGSALWLLPPDPSGIVDLRNSEGVTRWWLNLGTALAVAGIGALLRARSERDAVDADSTRLAIREIESLQQLSIALSGALSSSDVAHVVTTRAPEIVGARSVVVGLVEGEELSVIDRTEERPTLTGVEVACRSCRRRHSPTPHGRVRFRRRPVRLARR